MLVAQTATTALEEHHYLTVFCYVADIFARLSIIDYSSARNVYVTVLAISSRATALTAIAAMGSKDMTLIAQVQ